MKFLNRFGMALWICAAVFASPVTHSQMTLSAELAKPVSAAQGLIAEGKNSEALEMLDSIRNLDALAQPERILVEKLTIAAALGAKRYERVIQSTRLLMQSSAVTRDEKDKWIETLVGAYQSTRNNKDLISATRAYYETGGNNPNLRLPLAQALALEGQYQSALDELAKKGKPNPDASAKPPEAELRVAIYANSKLKNDAGLVLALKEVLAHYPKPDYWSDLVGALFRTRNLTKRQELDIYRLMDQVGQLNDEEDLLEMMDTALKVGLPKETLRLAAQMEKNKLPNSGNQAKFNALKKQADTAAAADEKFKQSSPASGNEWAQLADLYAAESNFSKAVTLYENALKLGDLKYEAETRLHLGIALYKADRVAESRKILATLTGTSPTAQLAEFWGLAIR